jgi:hypothetical protein
MLAAARSSAISVKREISPRFELEDFREFMEDFREFNRSSRIKFIDRDDAPT